MHTTTRIILSLAGLLTASGAAIATEEPAAVLKALSPPFKSEEFKKHVSHLASDELAGRAPGSEGAGRAAAYIIRYFKEFGLKPAREDGSWFQEFPLGAPDRSSGSITAKNVLAIFPGRGKLGHEAVVACAHYDHLGTKPPRTPGEDTIFNGADDNASGVAALLLIAQALTSDKSTLPESYRSVLFISFDCEEQGLAGSRFYVDHPVWPLDKTAAVINFDSVGRLRMGKFFAGDAETNSILADCVRDAARQRQLAVETRGGGAARTDHASFLDHGIPGLHFHTGVNADYHRVTDEVSRLNIEGGTTIAWIGYQTLRKAISYPDHFRYQKPDPSFDISVLLNLVQRIGIVPNVNAQDGRYPQILYVVPGSPAAKNGLESGDQITAVNGLVFTRVEDGISIFPQITWEDGVRFTVLRGTAKKDVTLPGSVFQSMTGPKSKQLENGKYDVEFRFKAPASVKAVHLAGEFNEWKATALRMDGPTDEGFFTTHVQLKEGSYEYKFVVDGKNWTPDPQNLYRVGKYDNSLLWVGSRHK
jgi:hypothetical protein